MVSQDKRIGKRIGNYVIIAPLSSGSMGTIYVAEHPEIGRRIAVKFLDPHMGFQALLGERFLSEARAVARIKHKNVIEIFDFGTIDEEMYYMMELLEGEELGHIIQTKGRFTPAEVLPYIEQITGALEAAHQLEIIHRDLKPSNIFVLSQTPIFLKLLDFGIAKVFGNDADALPRTMSGMVLGTPLYMPPEQAAGLSHQVGRATDIYSLGVIIFEMLSGRVPFMADAPGLLLAMHIRDNPPLLHEIEPSIPEAISQLIDRCLKKDPSDRPTSASEVMHLYLSALEAHQRSKHFVFNAKKQTTTAAGPKIVHPADAQAQKPNTPVAPNETSLETQPAKPVAPTSSPQKQAAKVFPRAPLWSKKGKSQPQVSLKEKKQESPKLDPPPPKSPSGEKPPQAQVSLPSKAPAQETSLTVHAGRAPHVELPKGSAPQKERLEPSPPSPSKEAGEKLETAQTEPNILTSAELLETDPSEGPTPQKTTASSSKDREARDGSPQLKVTVSPSRPSSSSEKPIQPLRATTVGTAKTEPALPSVKQDLPEEAPPEKLPETPGQVTFSAPQKEEVQSPSRISAKPHQQEKEDGAAPITEEGAGASLQSEAEDFILDDDALSNDELSENVETAAVCPHADEPSAQEGSEEAKTEAEVFAALLNEIKFKGELPAISKTVHDINQKTIVSNKVTAAQLSETILKDFSLTAKLLKLVNSAYYKRFSGPVTSISRAVVILGFDQVRMAALSLSLFKDLKDKEKAAELLDISLSSLMSGEIARKVAEKTNFSHPEEAFICGMFRNIGKHLVLYYLPQKYDKIIALSEKNQLSETAASYQVLGLSYEKIGAAFAQQWRLSDQLIGAMQSLPPKKIQKPKTDKERLQIVTNFAHEMCSLLEKCSVDNFQDELGALLKRYDEIFTIEPDEMSDLLRASRENITRWYASILDTPVKRSRFLKQAARLIKGPVEKKQSDKQAGPPGEAPNANGKSLAEGNSSNSESPAGHSSEVSRYSRFRETWLQSKAHILENGIQETNRALKNAQSLSEMLELILDTILQGFDVARVLVLIRDAQKPILQARAGIGQGVEDLLWKLNLPFSENGKDLFSVALRRQREFFVDNIQIPQIKKQLPPW